MLISTWLTAFRKSLRTSGRQANRRLSAKAADFKSSESLESRALLSAPSLVGVRPNVGEFLTEGEIRHEAPRELTLQFNPGQQLDPATVNSDSIQVWSSGLDDSFGDGNEVPVTLGFVGIGDSPEEIVVRFAGNLPDERYRIQIKGTGADVLANLDGEVVNDGEDSSFDFELDLGAQIRAIVPQPITRNPDGSLSQSPDTIVVYFNEDTLNVSAAENPAFYQLIHTNDTVENVDDTVHLPVSVSYDVVANTATLTFSDRIDALSGAGTYRLRVGSDESLPLPPVVSQFDETFVSDFGSGGAAVLTVDPIVSIDGNPIQLNVSSSNLGTGGVPAITVTGRQIDIVLDSAGGTTAGQLVWGINLHPHAGSLVRASISGSLTTNFAATAVPVSFDFEDAGSSFGNNNDLGALSNQAVVVNGLIRSADFPVDFPGDSDEPGGREIDVTGETHVELEPDSEPGISTLFYNFQTNYGFSPTGTPLNNLITETQKQRTREIFELYGNYLGVQFVESANRGFTIVTGDLRAIDPNIITGQGGVTGQASRGLNLAIMDNAESWDDSFAGSWFSTAMHQIGHLLGLGHAYELPDLTVMGGFDGPTVEETSAEPDFPGDADILHGQLRYRPENRDIDLYRFEVTDTGLFSAETVAERLTDASLLDTHLRLFRENGDGTRELVASNDDYFSEDSLIQLTLTPGIYFVGVSAAGNDSYDPTISDSGLNGTTQGRYQLRINFRPNSDSTIVDTTGTAFDGDHDGLPGGEFNFWFRAVTDADQIIVDKTSEAVADGSLAAPFTEIDQAFAAASAGDVVRIVGNGGTDGDVMTPEDNVAYQIGLDNVFGLPLEDGATLSVPQGVVTVVDAGAILKFQDSFAAVGSSSITEDRGGAAFQVLGTPDQSVIFTSWQNEEIGGDTSPTPTTASPGDWGGIVFRNDIDNTENRTNYERQGLFLDYVANADITYGGGVEEIDSVQQVVNPITLFESRPGLYFNRISLSADSAMSADPNSFLESTFSHPAAQSVAFTPDVSRVGPDIYGNILLQNSSNGLFVRIETAPGQPTRALTVTGRFDDTDIVHLVRENLEVRGTPGGPVLEEVAPSVVLVTLDPVAGGTLSNGTYNYRVVFTDSAGSQSPASAVTRSITLTGADGSVSLGNLPPASAPYNGRLLYRSQPGGFGPYELVASLNASDTTFTDDGTTQSGVLDETLVGRNRARQDASLVIDPEIIVKLEGSRIDVGVGGQLIAEGAPGREIVFTSMLDDRYGAGGTFDSNNDDGLGENEASPAAGNWGGIHFSPVSQGSLDQALLTFGGGQIPLGGGFATFNVIEVHQADVRIANSVLEDNASGFDGADRIDRTGNAEAVIFVRGAQPIIVGNVFRNNSGPAVSINVNALTSAYQDDSGRMRGEANIFAGHIDNQGPLLANNLMGGNSLNGMVVRGETLTTQSVWDDTDIVHILLDEVIVPNFHTYGGVRLNSDPDASLVVKLSGNTAGFTAGGNQLDIDDRIGGTVQIVGQPFFPVILTSLQDDTVGAGFGLDGLPLNDTNSDGPSVGTPGDWRSIRIEEFANNRNVAVYNENESIRETAPGSNATAQRAEFLGALGVHNLRVDNPNGTTELQKSSDENLRLGFEVNGTINSPNDVDVYSFSGTAGSEVWIDIDRSTVAFDPVVELITSTGTIIALSDNALSEANGEYPVFESNALTDANVLQNSLFRPDDWYTTNLRDAGFRVVLPGVFGTTGTYHVRVRSSNIDSLDSGASRADVSDPSKVFDGLTSGNYQLQIRLRDTDEVAGTTVVYADIRFAQDGIEIFGQPSNSPLIGEAAEDSGSSTIAQNVGNLLTTNRAAIAIAGRISAPSDVDLYEFEVTFDGIQDIPGHTDPNRYASVTFDVDYADGMARGNLQAHVFDETGRLILTSRDSNIAEDQAGPNEGADIDDLSRGSAGTLDPFIGPFELPEGTYFLAVSSHDQIPAVLNQTMVTNPVSTEVRLEPLPGVQRIADEHFGGTGTAVQPLYDLYDNEFGQNVIDYHLGDVNLFVSNGSQVFTVDPFTGTVETTLGTAGNGHNDLAMRPDGELFAYFAAGASDAGQSTYNLIHTGNASRTPLQDDGILTFHDSDPDPGEITVANSNAGVNVHAFTIFGSGDTDGLFVGTRGDGRYSRNLLYQFNTRTGAAISQGGLRGGNGRVNDQNIVGGGNLSGTDVVEITALQVANTITGIAVSGGNLLGVDTTGNLYQFNLLTGAIQQQVAIQTPQGAAAPLVGITVGPDEVEQGAYANTLFLTDVQGNLYAVSNGQDGNALGTALPIFVDGQTSVNIGIGAQGVAFSTLDYNLWALTGNRGTDPGHGLNESEDSTRLETPGGASLYFGNQRGGRTAGNKNDLGNEGTENDINFPGGAHGTFMSNPFSLEGYSAADLPVLYFNYLLDTDSNDYIPGVRPQSDSFRVYVGDGSDWSLVTTNNSFRATGAINDEFDFGREGGATQFPTTQLYEDVVEAYDESGVPAWRQARVDLSNFAGRENLRIRIEFATAGSVNVGDITTVGEELYTWAAKSLRDGESFILEGVNEFELDFGNTLVVPEGSQVAEQETVSIQGVLFEFDKVGDGPNLGGIPIAITDEMSGTEVAVLLERAIDAAGILNLSTYRDGNRINLILEPPAPAPLNTNVAVVQSVGAAVQIEGTPGVTPGTTAVTVHAGMTAPQVAEVVSQSMAGHLLPAGTYREVEPNDAATALGSMDLETFAWTNAVNNTVTSSATIPHVSVIGTSSIFTGTDFYRFVNPAPGRVIVDLDGTSPGFDSMLRIVDNMGNIVAENITGGVLDVGSNTVDDAFLDLVLPAGTFFVQVGVPPTLSGAFPTARYTLHLSVTGHATGVTNPLVVPRNIIKGDNDLVRVIGHYVTNEGPFGLTTSLPGDSFGGFFSSQPSLRGMNNEVEGVYIDDIIIGLAERGEMVTGSPANQTGTFIQNPEVNNPFNTNSYPDILEGEYDIEIRRASDYAIGSGFPNAQTTAFDSNDRLTEGVTIVAPGAESLFDGQTFSISDGVSSVTFEYEDADKADGVAQGNFAITFDSSSPDGNGTFVAESGAVIAARIRDAVNSPSVQGILNLRAALADGTVTGTDSTSNRVNLFGNAVVTVGDGTPGVDSDQQPEGVAGSVSRLGNTSGSSTLFRFENTSLLADPNTGFAEQIASISIQLPAGGTFDPTALIGGGGNGPVVNAASDFDTPTFTTLDALNPRIPVFSFTSDFNSMLMVFSGQPDSGFELGDVLLFGLDTDFGPEPGNLRGSIVEILFSSGRMVRAQFVESNNPAAVAELRPLADTTRVLVYQEDGDKNRDRDQGQLIISSNIISDSAGWGIVADAGARLGGSPLSGGSPTPGPVRNLRELNTDGLIPGVVIANNVVTHSGQGGIRFSGDANNSGATGPVPNGRILNNTIVGNPDSPSGIGIEVSENASPTILNNIVADLQTGISVDNSSQNLGTVIGTTLYRGNNNDAATGGIGLGTFPIQLGAADPLFIDEANRNYYPAPLSQVIDSSLDGVGDRTNLITVRSPLGIGVSPVRAPSTDVYGQLRGDDPDVSTPAAQGANVFKDRGAIDRVDFIQPLAFITTPLDNAAEDLDPALNTVWVNDPSPIRELVITLTDTGIGINDAGINSSQFTLLKDGAALVEGTDYLFVYNGVTNEVIFRSVTQFPFESQYTIEVDNSDDSSDGLEGVRDLAGNFLAANEADGGTRFHVLITDGINDAPFNVVPDTQTVPEDTSLIFSRLTAREIRITDPDAHLGTNVVEVTLTAANGILTLPGTFGLSFSDGDGFEDVSMTFQGDIADINTALDGLVFTPAPDFFGDASITVTTNDLGQFTAAPSPPETDTDTIDIIVTPVNDDPTFDLPGNPPAVDEDAGAVTVANFAVNITAGAPNETPPQTVSFQLSVTGTTGAWQPNEFFSVLPAIDPNTGDLTYTVADDVNGTAEISVTATDSEGATSAPKTFTITVNAINDEPVFTIDSIAGLTVDEDAGTQVVTDLIASFAAARATALDEVGLQGLTWILSSATVTSGNLAFDALSIAADGTLTYRSVQDTAGTAEVTLSLQDNGVDSPAPNDNLSAPVTLSIVVNPINDPPVAVTGDYVTDEGYSFTLDASGSFDVDEFFGDTLTYRWDLNGDGTFETNLGGNAIVTVPWSYLDSLGITAPDVINIRLQVTDSGTPTLSDTEDATLTTLIVDYGDAPTSFGTRRSDGGAAHTISGGLFLGAGVDKETDAVAPGPNADGDGADEDGVTFITTLEADPTRDLPTLISVNASAAGKLDAWIDFNDNGVFDHPAEHINAGLSYDLVAGDNELQFDIPAGTALGERIMRFRFSSDGLLAPTGRADDGEVEDYRVAIIPLTDAVTPTITKPYDADPGDAQIAETSDLTPTVEWTFEEENFFYDITITDSASQTVYAASGLTGTMATVPSDLAAGDYTIEVLAYNRAGEPAANPAVYQFRVVPMMVTSPDGLVLTNDTVFTWVPVAGTETYTVYVENTTTGQVTLIQDVDALTAQNPTQLILSPGLGLGNYRVRVQATDGCDHPGDWSPYVNFAVRIRPVITAPIGAIENQQPTITWNPVPGAVRYDLELHQITDNIRPLLTAANIQATSYTVPQELQLGEYTVWVRAYNANGESSIWSTAHSFLVTTRVTATAPLQRIASSGPLFAWEALEGADRYQLIVREYDRIELPGGGTDYVIGNTVIDVSDITGTTYQATENLPLGRYMFRVRGVNEAVRDTADDVVGSAGAVYQFVVTTAPQVTAPISTIFTARPEMTWNPALGAATSEIWLTQVGAADNPRLRVSGISGDSYVPTEDLGIGDYILYVRHEAVDGELSNWSTGRRFRVATPPPLRGPFGRVSDATPTLTWDPVPGAVSYEIWVDSVTTPVTRILNPQSVQATSYTVPQDLPIGKYRFWAKATNAFGQTSFWSAPADFEVVNGPVVSGPGSSTFDSTPTFTWSDLSGILGGTPAGAHSYDVRIDSVANGSQTLFTDRVEGTTEYTVPAGQALSNGLHRVFVRGIAGPADNETVGNWSAAYVVFIGGRPVVNPVGSTNDTTPTITWQAVGGAASYEIWLQSLDTGAVINEAGISGTSFTVESSLAQGNYRIWVRAVNAATGTAGLWSAPVDMVITDGSGSLSPQPASPAAGEAMIAVLPSDLAMGQTETSVGMMPTVTSPTALLTVADSTADAPEASDLALPQEEQQVAPQSDDVMAEWDGLTWWDEAGTESAAEAPAAEAGSDVRKAGAVGGLLGLFSLRRRRSEKKKGSDR